MQSPLRFKNPILIFLTLICFLFVFSTFAQAQEDQANSLRLTVFHSPGCHACVAAKNNLIPKIEREFEGRLQIEYRNIDDLENYKYLLGLRAEYAPDLELRIPVFYITGHMINGTQDLEGNLRGLINRAFNEYRPQEQVSSPDLLNLFKSFNLLGITVAGLEDGINPCAFTVIVFFISFLALQGYRKRELVAIGLAFIFAVFITYLLMGLGIFNFLYAIKGFWVITKVINLAVGVLSIILGILAMYDFFKFRRTKETEGLILQLPKAVKERIHSVIGMHYRKSRQPGAKDSGSAHLARLVISAITTGFIVSLLEAVCTGQLYLPTISFILKTTELKMQALGYLIYYNILFIVPLLIIFLLALLGVTSGQFAGFLKRHLGLIKIFMAVLFFSLGIFLVWRG